MTASATLKARAYKDGYNPSQVGSADYVITAAWVEKPTFSPPAGSYMGSLNVTISCATDGASIYYTTDGSTPTETSLAYNNPFTITASTTIKAKAFKDGCTASYVSSIHYVMLTTQYFVATADASIHFAMPNTNDGASERLTVRNGVGHPLYPPPPASWNIDALVRFDLSSIASDADIASAKLKLYYYDNEDNDPAGRTLSLFRATQAWNEATVTWNNQPLWAAAASDTSNVPNSIFSWMEWDVTSDVQGFVDGTISNYGWKVTDLLPWNNYNIPFTYFISREYSSSTPRPRLEVQLSAKGEHLASE